MTGELITETVVKWERCESPTHWSEIIILGECAKCHGGIEECEKECATKN